MGLHRCSECGAPYQPNAAGATLNLCGDCIAAGLNDSLYDETSEEDDLLGNANDFIDEPFPEELDDLDYN